MKSLKPLLILAILAVGLQSASAQVVWRVSVKVFTDASGNRPANRTDANIQDDYDYYNKLLRGYTRGCQFQLTEIVQMPASLSGWYSLAARDAGNRDRLLANATSNAVLYAYRNNAINLYINNSSSGVCCGGGNGLIFTGNEDNHITPVHEIGHMLGLAHTQGAGCNSCCPDPLGCCNTPGDDGIGDTILDLPCWSRDQVAQNNYGNTYANLNGGQQYAVDNVWLNIMSYHYGSFNNCLERLTPNQMDLVAEVSNNGRAAVTANRFRFVDGGGNDGNNGLTRGTPFRTVGVALARSANFDALQISAGAYNPPAAGNWTLNQPRVLCTRGGWVRLQRP